MGTCCAEVGELEFVGVGNSSWDTYQRTGAASSGQGSAGDALKVVSAYAEDLVEGAVYGSSGSSADSPSSQGPIKAADGDRWSSWLTYSKSALVLELEELFLHLPIGVESERRKSKH